MTTTKCQWCNREITLTEGTQVLQWCNREITLTEGTTWVHVAPRLKERPDRCFKTVVGLAEPKE